MSRMFSFITKPDWNPIGGECRINCSYCWAKKLIKRYPTLQKKYSGSAKIYPKELLKKFSSKEFVFVSDMRDLFDANVPTWMIQSVLDFISLSEAKFLLLTKNPERYLEFELPLNAIAGATIETDLGFGRMERILAMRKVRSPKMVSIEPIMNFSNDFPYKIASLKPEFVAVGYDNYESGLVEPPLSVTITLMDVLKDFGITVYEKTLREPFNRNKEMKNK
jgi:protein gp37